MLSLRNWHLNCAAIVLVALGAHAHPQESATPLLIAKQGSFFIGGRDVYSNMLSTNTLFPPSGTITVDQVYVRYQAPVGADATKIVLVHGCCLTGKTWETTPDGRPGWDEHFLRKGYSVYVVDQAARGRSAADPSLINSVKLGNTSPDQLPDVFSAGHEAAWTVFRFGPEYPKIYPGMRFPLDATGKFWKQMVPDWMRSLPTLGIRGNSHMLMQDDNNLEVADWLLAWIARNIGGNPEN